MVPGVLKSSNVNLTQFSISYNDEILHSDVRPVTTQYSIITLIYFYILKSYLIIVLILRVNASL